ncbi:MAG: hypothetical protein OK441_04910 [Thaumarchaeota archaeon]|nr:hypothetical protein [Nitrososphaerota archaeon]
MSLKLTRRLSGTARLLDLLRPLVELALVFTWVVYLLGLLRGQDYNGSVTFDLFLARVGGPTASHATTYLIFLSIFPIAYVILRSIIPAFLIEVLAFELHEGLWQVPYYVAWHSTVDWHVWLVENAPDTVTTFATIAILMLVYRFPARFFFAVTAAWGCFLAGWLALGFPVSVLSKLPNYQVMPSIYNTVLWVNQIEFLGWFYFALALLLCLRYLRPKNLQRRGPRTGPSTE